MAQNKQVEVEENDAKQDAMTERIANSVAEAVAKATIAVNERISPVEKRSPGLVSPYNPEGLAVRPKLTSRYIFCGAEMKEKFLTNEEITLLNQVTEPGQFNKGKWKVRVRKDDGDAKTVFIDVPSKSIDDRMSLPPSLKSLLQQIIAEQATPATA